MLTGSRSTLLSLRHWFGLQQANLYAAKASQAEYLPFTEMLKRLEAKAASPDLIPGAVEHNRKTLDRLHKLSQALLNNRTSYPAAGVQQLSLVLKYA